MEQVSKSFEKSRPQTQLRDLYLPRILDEFPSIRRVYGGGKLACKSEFQELRRELQEAWEGVSNSYQELCQDSHTHERHDSSRNYKDKSKLARSSKDKKMRETKRPKLEQDMCEVDPSDNFLETEDIQSPTPSLAVRSARDLWDRVDEFYKSVTQEEVSVMKRLSKRSLEDEWYETPPLGKHYFLRWGEEEESSAPPVPTSGFGPLTLRLLGSLIRDPDSTLSDYLPVGLREEASFDSIERNVR